MLKATWVMVLLLAASAASAEEWHEAYHAGLQALARGDNRTAAERLRRAIALRPEPGRNVVTYGTNVEARYYPYLRLAEAYLALGQLEQARAALAESAARGAEPADERRQIEAKLEPAVGARQPPPTTTPPPPTTAPPPATTLPPSPAAEPTAAPSVEPRASMPPPARASVKPAFPPPTLAHTVPPSPPPTSTPATEPTPGPALGGFEIASDPPAAQVYLDDEHLGSTDPQTGRLVKSFVPAGLHRIRVEFPEYETLARQIEVRVGASATIYATLTRRAPPQPAASATSPAFLAFGVVTVALVAVVVWMMLRRPEERSAIYTATPRPVSGRGLSPAPTPPGELNPGATEDDHGQQWFGDYRLHEILGRGGMASVYKAEKSGELSALKRPLGSLLGDADFVERFLREADIGRTLNHPNIVRILGRGDVEGVPYFTMELLTGQNVQAFIREWGAAEPRAAAEVVVQVAEALDFAHGKGVIHRDLKPSNIMLLQDGTAKVLDFGIARARRFEGITVTGAFLGTPDYVAPEVIEGHGAEPRSDLYSLGALFYELLTGQRLFTGETAFAILKKHCVEEPRQASTVRPGIPPELDAVLAQLLAKAPDGRPSSAEELVVMLRDWLNRAA